MQINISIAQQYNRGAIFTNFLIRLAAYIDPVNSIYTTTKGLPLERASSSCYGQIAQYLKNNWDKVPDHYEIIAFGSIKEHARNTINIPHAILYDPIKNEAVVDTFEKKGGTYKENEHYIASGYIFPLIDLCNIKSFKNLFFNY